MQFVDQAFARRLESAEEIPQVDCARMLQKLRPEIGADFAPICGGHMMFAGLNSPIGHAAGLGFEGPITAADLDCLEAFYRSHRAPAQLDICPLTDPSVLELVSARGYGMLELNNVLYRPIDSQEKFEIPSGIEIRRSNPAEADVFSELLTRSFFDKEKPPADFADMLAPLFHFSECLTFVATCQRRPRRRRRGARHSRTSRLCFVRGRHAARVPRPRNPDGSSSHSNESGGRSGLRTGRSRDTRRHHLRAQLQSARISNRVQQSNGD